MAAKALLRYRKSGGNRSSPLPDFHVGGQALFYQDRTLRSLKLRVAGHQSSDIDGIASISFTVNMTTITIRKLDDEIKTRLKIRAAINGHSMEQEVRLIGSTPKIGELRTLWGKLRATFIKVRLCLSFTSNIS